MPLLTSVVDELPDPYPKILGLVDLDGETVDDAAEIMGLSPGTVTLLCAEGRRRYLDRLVRRRPSRGTRRTPRA